MTLGYGPSSLHDGPCELQVQIQTELAGLSLKHFLLPGWREILNKYVRLSVIMAQMAVAHPRWRGTLIPRVQWA